MPERAGVDANVLVYAHDHTALHYRTCRSFLATPRTRLFLVPQVVTEFYAVITNGKRVRDPTSSEEALIAIDRFLSNPFIEVVPVPEDLVEKWMQLVREAPVVGRNVYDRQIAAVLISAGIRRIYTYDARGFRPVHGIEPIEP